MMAVLATVLILFVALGGPHGTTMYVAPSQIVAIIESPDVGACPTTLITMSQTVYVCESPAEVKRKLEAEVILNSEKTARGSFNSWNTLESVIQHPSWVQRSWSGQCQAFAPSDPPRH
jgi:hypothetical protein